VAPCIRGFYNLAAAQETADIEKYAHGSAPE
jgi:hypothetical protein